MDDLRSRPRRAVVPLLCVAFLVGGWLDRRETTAVELPAAEQILVISDAGPVVVSDADELSVVRRDSWLVRRPQWDTAQSDDGLVLRATCGRFWPCRSALEVGLPDGMAAVIVATGGSVHINGVDGDVTVHAPIDSGAVTLGSLSGSFRVVAEGVPVEGFALGLSELEVRTSTSDVDLEFVTPPDRVRVDAADHSARLLLPEGIYELLVGTDEFTTDLESTPGADHVVAVNAGESVVIEKG